MRHQVELLLNVTGAEGVESAGTGGALEAVEGSMDWSGVFCGWRHKLADVVGRQLRASMVLGAATLELLELADEVFGRFVVL